MAWTVEFTELVEKKLDKLDDETRKRIIRYFANVSCSIPTHLNLLSL